MQPMDQEMMKISRKFTESNTWMVVLESPEDLVEDTRGHDTGQLPEIQSAQHSPQHHLDVEDGERDSSTQPVE